MASTTWSLDAIGTRWQIETPQPWTTGCAGAAVDVTPHATDATSLDCQQRFAAGVGDEVSGKDIVEVHLDRVAGSSTTLDGCTDALTRIKADASRRPERPGWTRLARAEGYESPGARPLPRPTARRHT